MPVPEAEHAVAPWRDKLDPTARWGIPAHITILYPFVPPEEVSQETVIALSEAFSRFPAFEFVLTRIGWFGEEILYLAPDPDGPFRALTAAVLGLHPEFPPYGGEHTDVVPHLTVGHREEGPLDAAAAAIATRLPIRARASEVWLLGTRRGVGWHQLGHFQLPER